MCSKGCVVKGVLPPSSEPDVNVRVYDMVLKFPRVPIVPIIPGVTPGVIISRSIAVNVVEVVVVSMPLVAP